MDDLPGGRGQRDPKVIRLSHQYASCPSCQLILPLYDDSALTYLQPHQDLVVTLQQAVLAAKQLFDAQAAGIMLADADGQLRWASGSDQRAQTLEDNQEIFAAGSCVGVHHGQAGGYARRDPGASLGRDRPHLCRGPDPLEGSASRSSWAAARSEPLTFTPSTHGAGTTPRSAPCRPTPGWWAACSQRRPRPS